MHSSTPAPISVFNYFPSVKMDKYSTKAEAKKLLNRPINGTIENIFGSIFKVRLENKTFIDLSIDGVYI